MKRIGVFIGGSPLPEVGNTVTVELETPWGLASDCPSEIQLGNNHYVFMRRHGADRALSPHQVNYRANVWLMNELGVDALLGTHTVGSIDTELEVGELVLPDQLIDYTWGRVQTFEDERRHIEFSQPFDVALRSKLAASIPQLHVGGVYGCTQGPRLETAAEIRRLANDGCTIVGMTAMPEASLARELGLAFASLCVVVNPAAGIGAEVIDLEDLQRASQQGAEQIMTLLQNLAL